MKQIIRWAAWVITAVLLLTLPFAALAAAASTVVNGFTIYTPELPDWFSGTINNLWGASESYQVLDVQTGLVWNARKLYGTNHLDVEPLTAQDTRVLCQIYHVSSASQITSSTHYQRRPCLVTIGTRTFPCSLYGVPHGEQSIYNNNFDGQVCLHFLNSKKHGSPVVDEDHQDAIRTAYSYALNKLGSATASTTAAPTSNVNNGAGNGYVKVICSTTLKVRSAPGVLNEQIGSVASGSVLPFYAVQSVNGVSWYQVYVNGRYGWCSGEFLNVEKINGPAAVVTVAPTSAPTATVIPSQPAQSEGLGTVRVVTSTGVSLNVRSAPDTAAASVTYLANGDSVAYLETRTVGSITWYKVKTAGGLVGWCSGSYLKVTSVNATPAATTRPAATQTPTVKPTATNPPTSVQTPSGQGEMGYVLVTVSVGNGLNVRVAPKSDAERVDRVANGDKVPFLDTYTDGAITWYQLKLANGKIGWSSGNYLKVISTSATAKPAQTATAKPTQTVTAKPTQTATSKPTTAPTVVPTAKPADGSLGTVKVNVGLGSRLAVRTAPSTEAEKIEFLACGSVVPFYAVRKVDGVTWYQVLASGKLGWSSGAYLLVVTGSAATSAPTATTVPSAATVKPSTPTTAPTVKPSGNVQGYVKATISVGSKLNVRKEASTNAEKVGALVMNDVVPFYETKKVDDVLWYRVQLPGNIYGWCCGTFLKKQ